MSAREETIFPENISIGYFLFKMHQTKTKFYCMHIANCQTFSKNLPDFQIKGVWITSLAHAKCLFKIIFGHNYFISEPIFKIFVTLFTTLGLQKDDITLYTVDATTFVTAQIDATFHEGRGKWRTVS